MKTLSIIILSFFLFTSYSYKKSDKIRLEFQITDSYNNEPLMFSEIKLFFERTKGSKTYKVKREKTVSFEGKCTFELEKDIFWDKEITIEISCNILYDTLIQKTLIDQDVMKFNLSLNRTEEYLKDTIYPTYYLIEVKDS